MTMQILFHSEEKKAKANVSVVLINVTKNISMLFGRNEKYTFYHLCLEDVTNHINSLFVSFQNGHPTKFLKLESNM